MANGKRIRVLIVDDSAFMRKVLQGIIAADPQLEVLRFCDNNFVDPMFRRKLCAPKDVT